VSRGSSKYRPFGGEGSAKLNTLAPKEHIKKISMEFSKGDLKAKLKKVHTTKKKKRLGSIRNVYEKYPAKADYPKLDDLRNETLVSEFISFDLYKSYRSEANLVHDYSIDEAIICGCFYLPDPIGFRLGSFHTYEIFQDLCDELLSILHDEWNPKDRPHSKCTDWSLLANKSEKHMKSNAVGFGDYGAGINEDAEDDDLDANVHPKRTKTPRHSSSRNRHGHKKSDKERERKGSQGMLQLTSSSRAIKEKRKKSKRRNGTETTVSDLTGSTSVDLSNIRNIREITSKLPVEQDERLMDKLPEDEEQDDDDKEHEEELEVKSEMDVDSESEFAGKPREERRRRSRKSSRHKKSHKHRGHRDRSLSRERNMVNMRHSGHGGGLSLANSSMMMARMRLWDNDYISSCRITLSRNLHGFRFSNVMSRAERRNVEQILSACLTQCNEGPLKGRYRPYSKINKKKLPLLIETDKLFPKPDAPALIMAGYARDWPESRGIFINHNKNLYIWCNYLEHLHMISTQNDGNILMAFKRLFDSEQKLESLVKQRQQKFLSDLKQKQQEIIRKESDFSNDATPKSPTVISATNTGHGNVSVPHDNLVEFTPTPKDDDIATPKESPFNSAIGNESQSFNEMMRKQQDTLVMNGNAAQTPKTPNASKKGKGYRLTKQEYKIKKMDFEAMQTGFVFDDELGYISSNPQYFGTSMRVYVTVKLPNLLKHDKFNDILEIRNLTAYQHDVDSAQQMFLAYASQVPSNDQVRERRNSASLNRLAVHSLTNNDATAQLPKLAKIPKSTTSFQEDDENAAKPAISGKRSSKTMSNGKRRDSKKRDSKKLKGGSLAVEQVRSRVRSKTTETYKKTRTASSGLAGSPVMNTNSNKLSFKAHLEDPEMEILEETAALNVSDSAPNEAEKFRRKRSSKKRDSKASTGSGSASLVAVKRSSRSSSHSSNGESGKTRRDSKKLNSEREKKRKSGKSAKNENAFQLQLADLSPAASPGLSGEHEAAADAESFVSNLNLPDTSSVNAKQAQCEQDEPKISLKALTSSLQKQKSAPMEEKAKGDKMLIHDDEDLGDVMDPQFYNEEITIYQTVSLGISEVEQVQNMVDSINYLIEMEKLLSAGNRLDERIKAEKLKKQNKVKNK